MKIKNVENVVFKNRIFQLYRSKDVSVNMKMQFELYRKYRILVLKLTYGTILIPWPFMPEFLNVNYIFHKDFFIHVFLSFHLLMD